MSVDSLNSILNKNKFDIKEGDCFEINGVFGEKSIVTVQKVENNHIILYSDDMKLLDTNDTSSETIIRSSAPFYGSILYEEQMNFPRFIPLSSFSFSEEKCILRRLLKKWINR